MRRLTVATFLLAAFCCSSALPQQWAREMFKTHRHDFGTTARGAKAEFEFTFQNLYREDLHVASVRASCGCTSVRIKEDKRWLKTYETGAIVAHINSGTFLGAKGATITVRFDRPYPAEVQLQVKVYIREDVFLQPGSAQFGSVEQGTTAERILRVSSPGRSYLRIVDVRSTSPYISGEILAEGGDRRGTSRQLRVRLNARAPAGHIHGHLVLVTNDSRNSQVPVPVEGYVRPSISVSPSLLFMGVLEPGQQVRKQVVIRARDPFIIRSITSAGPFRFDLSAEQQSKSVHVVPVTFLAGDRPGKVAQAVRIETDRGTMTGKLLAEAMIVAATGRVPQSSATAPDALPDVSDASPIVSVDKPTLPSEPLGLSLLDRHPRLRRLVEARKAAMRAYAQKVHIAEGVSLTRAEDGWRPSRIAPSKAIYASPDDRARPTARYRAWRP